MKKNYFLLFVVAIIIVSCVPKTKTVPVDTAAVKAEVTTVLDKWHAAYQGKDLPVLMSLFSDDLLFCGPAPNEFWDKSTLSPLFERPFADTSFVISYSIIERNIKVVKDGTSAISTEHFFLDKASKKIQLRQVCHLVKSEGIWLIDYVSVAYIPNREDMGKINKALE
ncbi:MAG TPA: nuclear transport factor 2 family protein [Ignavibacteriaceae bacterium]